jgi:hypothetical protein
VIQPAAAQQFVTGYASDTPLQRGMIVRLKEGNTQSVVPLKATEVDRMHGVVVDANDAPATLSSDTQKTFVAVSGKFEVLVSNQNGEIKSGDPISISSTDGIGMKADTRANLSIGTAITGFDGKTNVVSKTTSTGREFNIGRVLVEITVGANPIYQPNVGYTPTLLQDIARSVSNKPVSPLRLYLSLLILLITGFITGALLFSSVRGGLVAIGRNPLSRKSITRNMLQVVVVAIIIFLSGLFGVYLLLKL